MPSLLPAQQSEGFRRLLDAVVRIDVREFAYEAGVKRFRSGVGSGVILSEDGLILTNAHVVGPRAVEINVTLANLERVSAELVGWDHWTDLALLRLDADEIAEKNFTFAVAEFGDSETLFPGQTVFAVGTPHGLTRTVTRGIISNPRRFFSDSRGVRGHETGMFNTWLQTDAAINPGNSGGPLVDEDGRVVGINSRGYLGADNLGFAIPAATARQVMAGLTADGSITRSYIGIVPGALQDLEDFYDLELNTGMLINSVDPGSPAAEAGLRGGDILLAIDGEGVDGRFPEQLPPIQNLIALQPLGREMELLVKRGDATETFTVTTEQLVSRVGEEGVLENWGLSVREVSRAYARENQLPSADGVLVIGVQRGSPGAEAGLATGDVIMKVNDAEVDSLAVVQAAEEAYREQPDRVLIEARRKFRVSLYVLKP
ncbi:trypsin-like peptidase domain-containing protein [Actomonas aquatica]|uniref:Trypsin-like peptidase domain-containing protein n=1 Tax=Actomonas aquatica TaxID=2866162 RepID=A0ABZ1C8Z7_9BACT|nr:trypsin-like peptidase domain-containing protein [Opitutus sp. WL0086]WRQ88105.1 trypsin-like peptidase domain-containing protein [Opitutus sp. WL0086]